LVKEPQQTQNSQTRYEMEEWILTQKSGIHPDAEIKICDEDE